MTTILCTHCYRPIPPGTSVFTLVDLSEAEFCSVACEQADKARRAGQTPAPSPIRVLVALVHNLSVVNREVTRSLVALGWGNRVQRAKDAHGIASIDLAWYTMAPRVDDLRNMALAQAMEDGFTHVLFLDADMLHPDTLFEQMLRHVHRQVVVSGFYTLKAYPFAPVAMRDGQLHESGRYSTYRHDHDYTEVDADGLRDEEVVGMGCCLIPLSIVRALGPRPWFEYRQNADGWHLVSEDVPFCEKVRAAGFRVCLDPSIQCGHLYTEFATEAHWKRAEAVRQHTQERLSEAMQITVQTPGDPMPVEAAP